MKYVRVPLVGQYSGASFLPFVADSSRRRETVAASTAGSSLAVSMWPGLTWLLLYDSDQRHRGQWERMSSMEVGIWRRIVTGGKNRRTAIRTFPFSFLVTMTCWSIDFPFTSVRSRHRRSLPATPSYFAFRRRPPPPQRSRLAGKQSMRGRSRSGMLGGRSVARCGDW